MTEKLPCLITSLLPLSMEVDYTTEVYLSNRTIVLRECS